MTEKITVRVTPAQAAYLSAAGWQKARDYAHKPKYASVYRGGARALRSALIGAGWEPVDDGGWYKPPAPSSEKDGAA